MLDFIKTKLRETRKENPPGWARRGAVIDDGPIDPEVCVHDVASFRVSSPIPLFQSGRLHRSTAI